MNRNQLIPVATVEPDETLQGVNEITLEYWDYKLHVLGDAFLQGIPKFVNHDNAYFEVRKLPSIEIQGNKLSSQSANTLRLMNKNKGSDI